MNFSGGSGGGGRENDFLHMMMKPLPLPLNPDAIGGGDDGDGEFPKRDERVPQWSQLETRDLIAIRAELERDFTVAKRNKTLWEVVSARMRELGYRRTADQCKCKWKNLVNRYKGKETSDLVDGRQFPFFEELHAIFTEREKNMQRMLLESEAGSTQAKKKVKRISGDQSSEEFSYYEDEDEVESDGQRVTSSSNPRKRKDDREKVEKEKQLRIPRQPSTGNVNNSGNSIGSLQEMLQEFLQQQQRIEMMWKESIERHAYERQMLELKWQQSMEKLERERLMAEQAWREREEQRRIREESRAEKRDALLTTLFNRLINENHP
ncbi:trihelix transcription factor GT-3b-like [Actinidia eriantha]|uniref:trihelix transcription factor GT-3b-like n=1 Tax=Actinidia eriantha TaxID=165200 RepID=UPI002583CDC2|nr:trihelix transcription factor GT-3b-like [Actinidia eriantha]